MYLGLGKRLLNGFGHQLARWCRQDDLLHAGRHDVAQFAHLERRLELVAGQHPDLKDQCVGVKSKAQTL